MTRPLVVVMGVAGSGKTTVGHKLAEVLGADFIDGDALHPPANVSKMASGIPLTDEDRWPWLAVVGRTLADAGPGGMVVACSALRRMYRAAILDQAPETRFVELDGSPELLQRRIEARVGHFMPAGLLASQLATLEPLAPDEPGVRVDIDRPTEEIVSAAAGALRIG